MFCVFFSAWYNVWDWNGKPYWLGDIFLLGSNQWTNFCETVTAKCTIQLLQCKNFIPSFLVFSFILLYYLLSDFHLLFLEYHHTLYGKARLQSFIKFAWCLWQFTVLSLLICAYLQITFRGVDNGIPPKRTIDTRNVIIRINRNTACPTFVTASAAALDETVEIGTLVTVVTASDLDTVSLPLLCLYFSLQKLDQPNLITIFIRK